MPGSRGRPPRSAVLALVAVLLLVLAAAAQVVTVLVVAVLLVVVGHVNDQARGVGQGEDPVGLGVGAQHDLELALEAGVDEGLLDALVVVALVQIEDLDLLPAQNEVVGDDNAEQGPEDGAEAVPVPWMTSVWSPLTVIGSPLPMVLASTSHCGAFQPGVPSPSNSRTMRL